VVKLMFAVAMLALSMAVALPAQAQTFNVVYSFTGGSDGGNPLDGLIADSQGNFYATTNHGGAFSSGVVFKLSKSGVETVLHSFAGGTDGAYPEGGLIRDSSGNLYGTTTGGGASGAGTAFIVSSTGVETVLYSFAGGKDGAVPEGGLLLDGADNLFGTTTAGGANGTGTVFRLRKQPNGSWVESIVYNFGAAPDGAVPVAGVSIDKSGNLYGTTSAGGAYGYGTVFQLKRSGQTFTETILQNFQDGDDGAVPYAGLIADKSGNFYGAATEGGSGGGGTVFKLTPAGGTYTFSVIYTYPGWGISGTFRNLAIDSKGNLYATTHCDGANSAGTVYELTPSGSSYNFTLLYTFTGGTDGLYSFSNPVVEQDHVYGTTNIGGGNGNGDVWEVTL